MDPGMGHEADTVAFFARLAEAPYSHDFYQTMRRLECLFDEKPRWGEALRPVDEAVRFGQEPDLSFAPAPLASFGTDAGDRRPRLQVRLFGLLGPNGPLPIHLTEYARERLRNAGDRTLSRFLDVFNHRFLTLFYRAWAQAQPHVNRDRPNVDRFAGYVAAFFGFRPAAFRGRDTVPDVAKFFHVGSLVRHVRHSDGLRRILQHFFRVPVAIEEFVGHWLLLGPGERTFLAREGATLGAGAVVGSRVWDRQHKFRIRMGPLTLAQYESFLPVTVEPQTGRGRLAAPKPRSGEGGLLNKLADWVRLYLSFELEWDLQLILKRREVPRLTLDGKRHLGWTTWLGTRTKSTDADDLHLRVETVIGRVGAAAA